MSSAAKAYAATQQATTGPRELEAMLLVKAAVRLQNVQTDWDTNRRDLEEALFYNRKLWTLFVAAMQQPDRPVPDAVRQNILNLGLFVFKQTLATQAEPTPQRLSPLIEINRNLAAGLRGRT